MCDSEVTDAQSTRTILAGLLAAISIPVYRKQQHDGGYRLGPIMHGLYAARILNAEERVMVAEWQELVVSLRAQYPGEEDRIDLLVIYWLFLFRAIQADYGKAIQRAGRAIRTHLNKLTRPRRPTPDGPTPHWRPVAQLAWQRQFLTEMKKPKPCREYRGDAA